MNINYNFRGPNGADGKPSTPTSVQIMVHMILGCLLSIAVMSAAVLAQLVIYLCVVIAELVG